MNLYSSYSIHTGLKYLGIKPSTRRCNNVAFPNAAAIYKFFYKYK